MDFEFELPAGKPFDVVALGLNVLLILSILSIPV